jgi:hypothetical protein
MRRFGDLLKDLGFNPNAPLATQKAFFRHLVKHAELSMQNASVTPIREENSETVRAISPASTEPIQLSFDPEILNPHWPPRRLKKPLRGHCG